MKVNEVWKSYKKVLWLVIFIWIIFILSVLVPAVNDFGIIPRSVTGLPGIICAPFLHANFLHIFENTIGLLMLGFFMTILDDDRLYYTLVPIILIGGLGTWLIGRSDSIHLGASGMIFGMLGYLIAVGIFRMDIKSIIISVLVFFLYGGMIFGVFPSIPSVSWESHMCGFFAGVLTASGTKKLKRK